MNHDEAGPEFCPLIQRIWFKVSFKIKRRRAELFSLQSPKSSNVNDLSEWNIVLNTQHFCWVTLEPTHSRIIQWHKESVVKQTSFYQAGECVFLSHTFTPFHLCQCVYWTLCNFNVCAIYFNRNWISCSFLHTFRS